MSKKIHILLVDDDEEDYLITRDTIAEIKTSQPYKLDWTPDYQTAMQTILEKRHDVYLIDYKLGAHNGLEIITEATRKGLHAPFILLTGLSDREVDEKAMKLGASDYLVKGTFNAEELHRVIRYSLRDAKYMREIRELNTDLETRVKERTAELEKTNKDLQELLAERETTQRELRKALEQEKELGALKARFVTMASHEFRTPLSTILSSTCLAEKYNQPNEVEKRLKHLERIKLNVGNLNEILNDFLSLGKLEDGKITPEPLPFIFTDLVHEVINDFELLLKKGQRIQYAHEDLDTGSVLVADKKLVKNILINLLSNAVKYSGEGKVIELNTESQPHRTIIQVKDHGIGIPQKDQGHLFERFYRAENTVNIQGTGLGLNIVKKYLELLKGEISFTSQLHEGTTFTVTLPN